MSKKEKYQQDAEAFVAQLAPYAPRPGADPHRGDRALLKRYWSPATRGYALPVLGRLRAIGNDAKTITAALFAVHPQHKDITSFGETCRRVAGKNRDTFEPHFRRLLACETLDELAVQLPRLVKRAERGGAPINFVQLLLDLGGWRFYAEDIKTRWAKDFWQAPDPDVPANTELQSAKS